MRGLRRATADERRRVEEFQRSAYARTEAIIGAPAIPLEWDYSRIHETGGSLQGVLILRVLADELFLESIGVAPVSAGTGRGRVLFEATLERARALGLNRVGLITNGLNPALAWYNRMGFRVDREEAQPGRSVVHMSLVVPTD